MPKGWFCSIGSSYNHQENQGKVNFKPSILLRSNNPNHHIPLSSSRKELRVIKMVILLSMSHHLNLLPLALCSHYLNHIPSSSTFNFLITSDSKSPFHIPQAILIMAEDTSKNIRQFNLEEL